ncbi:hypothetical protein CMO83_01035 [Candidatus Woesearchaeota archaeon]|jgi:hypothetical protein|nr:hypothetical protein [Candidatus Woesearchaeota archaeon]MDP6648450.1 hypothetical protein [Candidatus Woesearchaeota archaeon]|tara:strand:- start:42046 stop:42564 length:519 start_codon:yes stop_codon:yes gene_type:complete
MAFFRIKKIKGKEYAYLVENEWSKKGSRQTVKGYLGKIHRFQLKNDVGFLQHLGIGNFENYVNENDASKIIYDLFEWEFFKFGISKEEFSLDLDERRIQQHNKKIVLLINDGYMCNLTLKNLLDFKSENDEEKDGYMYARAFVEAGIKVPQEVFVGLFGKLYKTKEEVKENG